MEKIKPILDLLKKHHFWLLSAICVVAMLYSWSSAVSDIQEKFAKNKMQVEGEFQKMQQLKSQTTFPNQEWEKKTLEKGEEVVKRVKTASQQIVKEEKSALTWSENFSELFRETAAAKTPDQWPAEMLEEFRLVLPEEVKRLREVIGAAEGLNQPGVQWKDDDYNQLLTGFTWETPPTNADVMQRMTIFWLFENLANIVAKTNDGAADPFNLPIHDLEVLGVSGMANFDASEWRLAGLPDISGGIQPKPIAGYTAWPVRIRARMNLKYLNKLLAACANSDLPLEVQGLRFSHPSRLIVIEQPKEKQRTFRVGGFGGRKEPPQENETEQEEEKKELPGRGTLVELWGIVYMVDSAGLDQLFAAPAATQAMLPPAAAARLAATGTRGVER